jgi:hypothetical protein
MDHSHYSVITAAACLFIIMSIAGCSTLTDNETIKQAIEKRRQCEPTQPPITIIFVED